MPAAVPTCLVCDDHALMRTALADLVAMIWPGASVATAASFEQAWVAAAAQQPGLILCDLGMPGAKPLDGIAMLRQKAPASPILVVTASDDNDLLMPLFDLGAAGFVPKNASSDVLEAAIRLVAAGSKYLPPQILHLLRVRGDGFVGQTRADTARLSGRQMEVLRLMARGDPNKEIARQLDLSPATVKTHVAALLSALGAANRTEAVIKAHGMGLI